MFSNFVIRRTLKKRQKLFTTIVLLVLILFRVDVTFAHAPEENYVWLNVEVDHISGRFELNINDVESKLMLQIDQEDNPRLAGLLSTQNQVRDYLLDHFQLEDSQGPMVIEFEDATLFDENTDFLQYPFRINQLPNNNIVNISNTIFLTPDLMINDRLHRSLVVVEYNRQTDKEFGSENVALVFSPDKRQLEVDLNNPPKTLEWKEFLAQGIKHIAIGPDHILFIILLVLTAPFRFSDEKWIPIQNFKTAFWNILKIVTIFTISHSITLSLAALDLVSINIAFVEIMIALSIVAVAINNLYPRFSQHSWLLIFVFGLFHGLGFASVMGDLQFRTVLIERILILFNVGVEIGQLVIVIALFPILFLIRKFSYYKQFINIPVSSVAIVVGCYWVAERAGFLS